MSDKDLRENIDGEATLEQHIKEMLGGFHSTSILGSQSTIGNIMQINKKILEDYTKAILSLISSEKKRFALEYVDKIYKSLGKAERVVGMGSVYDIASVQIILNEIQKELSDEK